jgi:hypothetical protein
LEYYQKIEEDPDPDPNPDEPNYMYVQPVLEPVYLKILN